MVIKIDELRKEINNEDLKKANKLEISIDKELVSKKRILFNGKSVNIYLGENKRICEYLKQKYQKTNKEVHVKIYGFDNALAGPVGLNFKIKSQYLK